MRMVALVQLGILLFLSTTGFTGRTPFGVHCPTAAVQFVSVKTPSKSCCPATTEVRAPRPGEKDFKQCQCAEKKSSKAEAEKESRNGDGQRFAFLPISAIQNSVDSTTFPRQNGPVWSASLIDVAFVPLNPPPNFI